MTEGFESPESAAMQGFPAQYCRVVASRAEGDDAYVLLDTGPVGQPYLYGVYCVRRDGSWYDCGDSNGYGWGATDAEGGLGTLTLWHEAPTGADMVRAEYDGQVIEAPVRHGAYLAVWFRQPAPQFNWPTVIAIRVDGKWIPRRAMF